MAARGQGIRFPQQSPTEGGISSYEASAGHSNVSYPGKSPSAPARSLTSLFRTPSQRVSASINKSDLTSTPDGVSEFGAFSFANLITKP